MTKQKILFSGIKPTGIPHLGNYLGALQNWVTLQNDYHCIYSIVDYHALTIDITPAELKKNTIQTAKILLAIGIDPSKTILFVQSHVPQHTELTWIFNCLVPVSEMERMTQYKDKAAEHKQNINMGLFDYPALMAADILLYQAEKVPVGEDQLQHLELTRLICRKFNSRYSSYFREPQAVVGSAKRVMSLSKPNKKMSKDQGQSSYISLIDKPEDIKKKIMKAVTDTGPNQANKMSAGVKNLTDWLLFFGEKETYKKYIADYKTGSIKYSDLKNEIAGIIISHLEPIQKKYNSLSDDQVKKILVQGSNKAQEMAEKNIKEIKKIIGLI